MKTIKVLLVENMASDILLMQELLKHSGVYESNIVVSPSVKDGCEQLSQQTFDVILLSLHLPDSRGRKTFETIKNYAASMPIIVISEQKDADLFLSLVKAGAQDYLPKQQLNGLLLERTIKHAIYRKRHLEEAKQTAIDWQNTFDSIEDMVMVINPEHKIKEVNAAGLQSLQKTREEVIGQHCYYLVHGTNSPIAECPCVAALKTKEKVSSEYTNNGKIYELKAFPLFDEDKEIISFTHIIKDITERRQNEEKIAKNEQNFRNFIDNSPLAIYFFDEKTRKVLFANPAFYQLLGYTEADALTIYDFVHHSKEEMDKTLHNVTKGVKLTIGEREWKAKNGTIYKMFVNASYINSEYERIIYVTAQDITALKITQVENEALIKELSDKYNELMQFNYIVSHNLRAPIASILGLSSILSLPDTSEQDKLEVFQLVKESVIKMEGLTQDLNLILSTRSAINTQRENITITDLLKSIADTLEKQIKDAGCVIKTDVSKDATVLFTVKSYFESILYNLISNAIKYRAKERELQITVSARKETNTVIITVSDNGIGIDTEKYRKQLFGLYKRFDLSVEGKGLGLHMTKTQVETLGGKITVESEINKGTTFIVTLPA